MKNSLSDRIKVAMQGPPNISGVALAKACGVAAASVSDWRSGKTKTMEAEHLLNAAECLRVREKWLAKGIGPMREDGATRHDGPSLLAGVEIKQPKLATTPAANLSALSDDALRLAQWLDGITDPVQHFRAYTECMALITVRLDRVEQSAGHAPTAPTAASGAKCPDQPVADRTPVMPGTDHPSR
jgi:hypothetical protein